MSVGTAVRRLLVLPAVLVGLLLMHGVTGIGLVASGEREIGSVRVHAAHSMDMSAMNASGAAASGTSRHHTDVPAAPAAPRRHETSHQVSPCTAVLPQVAAALSVPTVAATSAFPSVALARQVPAPPARLQDDGRDPPDLTRLCISRT